MKKIKCNCKNQFQDDRYGKNIRIGNKTSNGQYRCTVCGTVRDAKKSGGEK